MGVAGIKETTQCFNLLNLTTEKEKNEEKKERQTTAPLTTFLVHSTLTNRMNGLTKFFFLIFFSSLLFFYLLVLLFVRFSVLKNSTIAHSQHESTVEDVTGAICDSLCRILKFICPNICTLLMLILQTLHTVN